MKGLILVVALCTTVGFAACGGSSSTDGARSRSDSTSTGSSSARTSAKRPEPKVPTPKGPLPGKLVIRDLATGSGAAAKEGDELWVHYAGLDYRTHKEFETSWILTFKFELGSGFVNDGWERGLAGMRVGGRRELIVPPRLAFGHDTLVYLVDLVAIK